MLLLCDVNFFINWTQKVRLKYIILNFIKLNLNWECVCTFQGGDKPDIHPELWTDEELGIPPDEEDIYPPGYNPMKHRV